MNLKANVLMKSRTHSIIKFRHSLLFREDEISCITRVLQSPPSLLSNACHPLTCSVLFMKWADASVLLSDEFDGDNLITSRVEFCRTLYCEHLYYCMLNEKLLLSNETPLEYIIPYVAMNWLRVDSWIMLCHKELTQCWWNSFKMEGTHKPTVINCSVYAVANFMSWVSLSAMHWDVSDLSHWLVTRVCYHIS